MRDGEVHTTPHVARTLLSQFCVIDTPHTSCTECVSAHWLKYCVICVLRKIFTSTHVSSHRRCCILMVTPMCPSLLLGPLHLRCPFPRSVSTPSSPRRATPPGGYCLWLYGQPDFQHRNRTLLHLACFNVKFHMYYRAWLIEQLL